MRRRRLIGICGGIGSGKSVVSRLFRLKGFEVYDCDIEARRLMEGSVEIKRRIRDEISAEVTDGVTPPRRDLLAGIVFADEEMRRRLNSIVHGAVRDDLRKRLEGGSDVGSPLYVESAILAESGLAEMCDEILRVESDPQERLRRVTGRDHCTEAQALERMRSQRREEELLGRFGDKINVIHNDDHHSLILSLNEQNNQ